MGGGGSPTPAPGGPPRGGTTCGLLLVVGGTELGPFGGARPKGPLGPFPFFIRGKGWVQLDEEYHTGST